MRLHQGILFNSDMLKAYRFNIVQIKKHKKFLEYCDMIGVKAAVKYAKEHDIVMPEEQLQTIFTM